MKTYNLIILIFCFLFSLLTSSKISSSIEPHLYVNISKITQSSNSTLRPEMPDDEPEVLAKMEESLINSQSSKSIKNVSISGTMTSFRFAENTINDGFVKNINEKIDSDNNNWEAAKFSDAFSNSVFTFAADNGRIRDYPALNAIFGWSYWCSTGNHKKTKNSEEEDKVYWMGSFEYPKRIHHLRIRWAYAPGFYKIETSNDGQTWFDQTSWRTAFKGTQWQWLSKIFWWWRWYYMSYAELITFDTPIWAQHIRISLRDPIFNFFGIYRVEALIKQWVVMLRTQAEGDLDGCLVTADGQGNDGAEAQLMECTEAIAMGDGRELWIVQNNFQILSYVGKKCLELKEGDNSDNARIQINNCWITNSYGDGRDKWLIEPSGKIIAYKDRSKCLTAFTNQYLENVAYRQKAIATSTLDSSHSPHLALDGQESNYWASSPGISQNSFTVSFNEPKTIREIKIRWKYYATDFEIFGLRENNIWEGIETIKNNDKAITKTRTGTSSFYGVKIVMYRGFEMFEGKVIYGIIDLQCQAGTKPVKLKECNEGEDFKSNVFLMEDVEFVDLEAAPKLNFEKNILIEKTNRIIDLANVLTTFPLFISKLVEKAKELDKKINEIEEKLITMDIKISIMKDFFISENEISKKASALGSNSLRPAQDCHYIHRAFPHKLNGFYWVQPECAPHPFRAFCEFTLGSGIMYYFFSDNIKTSLQLIDLSDNFDNDVAIFKNFKNLQKIEDVQYLCSKNGLTPLELKVKGQTDSVINYIKELQVDFKRNEIIPLAYDWNCLKGGCSGRFRSMSNEYSPDFTDELVEKIDPENILNMEFNLKGFKKDAIGFASTKNDGLMYFKLGEFKLKGIICSSFHNEDLDDDYINLDCYTTLRGNPDIDNIQKTNIKINCPSNCVSATKAKVFGHQMYKDDSSICRAAIHSGHIKNNLGGKIEIQIEEGINNYESVLENGVQSEAYERMGERSFIVKKAQIICPGDRFRKQVKSWNSMFIEKDEQIVLLQDTNLKPKIEIEEKTPINIKRSVIVQKKEGGNSLLLNLLKNNKDKQQVVISENKSVPENIDKLVSLTNEEGSTSKPMQKTTILKNEEIYQSKMIIPPLVNQSKIATTEDAINQLEHIYGLENESLKKHLKLIRDSDILVKELNKLLDPVVNKNFNSDLMKERLDVIEKHVYGTNNILEEIIRSAQNKLRALEKENNDQLLEKRKIVKFQEYMEDFSGNSLEENYEIADDPKATEGPSKWGILKSNIQGHSSTISQTSNIRCISEMGCTASVLVLKYNDYYDGIFESNILLKDNDEAGFIFRFKNLFNYYCFEIRQEGIGWKRIRKVTNGISKVISYVEDGGFLQNVWYKVIIVFRAGAFEVKMAEESRNLPSESMPIVISGEDQEIARGRVGFLVNGMQGIFLDQIHVHPLDCIAEPEIPEISYFPPECSRFKETYYGQIESRWIFHTSHDAVSGPAVWQFENNIFGKEKVIYQSSDVFTNGPEKIGTLAILNFEKTCKNGVISLDFYPESDGIVGILVKYKNPKYYYIFEIGSDHDEKFIQMRKVIDGKHSLLVREETIGYRINEWHQIRIFMEDDTFKFYFSVIGEAPTQIFDPIINKDLLDGTIGLSTFKTSAAFDNIRLSPKVDILENDKLYSETDKGTLYEDDDMEGLKEKYFDTEIDPRKISWSACISHKTPESKKNYCSKTFKTVDKITACYKNFCDSCCTEYVDWLHPVHRFHCTHQCQESAEASTQTTYWKTACFEMSHPRKTIYNYCENTFEDVKLMNKCKLDSCRLCCLTSQQIESTVVKEEVVQKCEVACFENFKV